MSAATEEQERISLLGTTNPRQATKIPREQPIQDGRDALSLACLPLPSLHGVCCGIFSYVLRNLQASMDVRPRSTKEAKPLGVTALLRLTRPHSKTASPREIVNGAASGRRRERGAKKREEKEGGDCFRRRWPAPKGKWPRAAAAAAAAVAAAWARTRQ